MIPPKLITMSQNLENGGANRCFARVTLYPLFTPAVVNEIHQLWNPNIHLVVEHMYVVQSVYYYQQTRLFRLFQIVYSDYLFRLFIKFFKNVN